MDERELGIKGVDEPPDADIASYTSELPPSHDIEYRDSKDMQGEAIDKTDVDIPTFKALPTTLSLKQLE